LARNEQVNDPANINFEGIPGEWMDSLALDATRVTQYRAGRIGTCLVAAMVYLSMLSVSLLVPDWSEEKAKLEKALAARDVYYDDEDEAPPPSTVFRPMAWKQTRLLWMSLCVQCALLVVIEFSYSNTYKTHVYRWIVMFKVLRIFIDFVLEHLLREHLLV
ncbi:unnamed protein product, partial [Phaeothamnion confervicola]